MMKKLLQKKTMLLLCTLLLFSLGCMGVLAVAGPSNGGKATAETEVMTEGAVPLGGADVDKATPADARDVRLDAGDGRLGGEAIVKVSKEGKLLADLPVPTREGWTFEGWYTEKVTEIYLNGGDKEGDGVPYTAVSEAAVIKALKEQVKGTSYANLSDSALLQKHHSWLIESAGQKVQQDTAIDKDVDTLYAKYKPKTVNVHWNDNGWQGSNGVLKSSAEYGGYIYTWDQSTARWGDRVFEGWSFEKDGEVALKNGYVYKLGGGTLKFTDKDTIEIYAVWSGGDGRDVQKVEVSVYNDYSTHRPRHYPEAWKYFLEYKLLPEEAFDVPVTWSMEPADAGYFIEQGTKNRVLAVIYTQGTDITVTIKAEAGGVTGSLDLSLKHSWNRNYTWEPTCQHDGYAVDVCSVCGAKNQPKFPKTPHKFSHIDVPATCTEAGHRENVCQICGLRTITDETPATGHTWGAIQTVQSCGGAVETKTCTVCGFTETNVDVNDAAHQWESVMTVDKEPTCSEAGSRSYHCAVCGLTKGSETIPANPELHIWRGWVLVQSPQVGVMGTESRECSICKVKEIRDIEALLPSVESVAEAAASGAGDNTTTSTPTTPSSSSSSSSSSRGSGGGGGGGGGGASRGVGSSPVAAAAGTTPLPTVPTPEIREALPQYVEVGNWNQAADGSWTFQDEDGQAYVSRWAAIYNPYANKAAADAFDWFRFDATGHLITGWYTDPADGCTYYMNPASDGTQGRMMTGWVTIDGKEYYFNPNSDGQRGRMFRNEATPDGHFVDANGVKIR